MSWGEGEIWPIAPCTLLRLHLSLASCFTATGPGGNNFCTISTSFKHWFWFLVFFLSFFILSLQTIPKASITISILMIPKSVSLARSLSWAPDPYTQHLKDIFIQTPLRHLIFCMLPAESPSSIHPPALPWKHRVLTTGWPGTSPGKAFEHEHLWLAYYCLKQCVCSSVGILLHVFIPIPPLDARLGYASKARALVQSLVGNLDPMYLKKWKYIYIMVFF